MPHGGFLDGFAKRWVGVHRPCYIFQDCTHFQGLREGRRQSASPAPTACQPMMLSRARMTLSANSENQP